MYFFPFLCFPYSFSSFSLPSLLLFLSSIILTSTSQILPATQLLLYTPLPSYLFLLWLQPNNESPKSFQLSMWGRSGHVPLGLPGVLFYCRDCFEATCSGTWAANGVRSCQRGAALSHMPSHHTSLVLPYLTASLSQFVRSTLSRWTTLSAAAACYQSPGQGELRMFWVHACETDRWACCHPAHLSCFLPLTSLDFQVPLPTSASGTSTSVLFLYSTCAMASKLACSSLWTARFSSTVTIY